MPGSSVFSIVRALSGERMLCVDSTILCGLSVLQGIEVILKQKENSDIKSLRLINWSLASSEVEEKLIKIICDNHIICLDLSEIERNIRGLFRQTDFERLQIKSTMQRVCNVLKATLVTHLYVSHIREWELQELCKSLPNTDITHLFINYSSISSDAVKFLVFALPKTLITKLDLEGCTIQEGDFKTIINVLPKTIITNLNISKCGIKDAEFQALNRMLTLTLIFAIDSSDNPCDDPFYNGATAVILMCCKLGLNKLKTEILTNAHKKIFVKKLNFPINHENKGIIFSIVGNSLGGINKLFMPDILSEIISFLYPENIVINYIRFLHTRLYKTFSRYQAIDPNDRGLALRKAAANGNIDDINFLLENGISINTPGKESGKTALHWASKNGHEKCVLNLLGSGANPKIKDQQNKTAAEYSSSLRIDNIFKLYM